ncbi:MAG: hypothetical protein J2P41_15375 [Blastocatellia bacterium]|nr:hypothetical protein [Blastocatellia bacterium]
MLVITKNQMEALRRGVRAEFIRRTQAVIRKAAPGFLAGLDDAAALKRVENSVVKAESHGMSTEREIRDFIALQAVAGGDFDSDPRFAAAQEALRDANKPAGDRLARARLIVAETLAGKKPEKREGIFPDLGGDNRPADSTVIPCPNDAISRRRLMDDAVDVLIHTTN